jgi:hypothetical protein
MGSYLYANVNIGNQLFSNKGDNMKISHLTTTYNKNKILQEGFKYIGTNRTNEWMTTYLKPDGVYFGVDDSWKSYLQDNWISRYEICTEDIEVELSKDINLIKIKSKEQFLKLFKDITKQEYSECFESRFVLERNWSKLFHLLLIDRYDGMWVTQEVINKHRLDVDCDYFYSWDAESIVVWNLDKIKVIT